MSLWLLVKARLREPCHACHACHASCTSSKRSGGQGEGGYWWEQCHAQEEEEEHYFISLAGVDSAPEAVPPAISPREHDGAMCPCTAPACMKQWTIHPARDAPASVTCWWQPRSARRRPNHCREGNPVQDR